MYDNEYFVVDMASCLSTGEIINSLSLALETLNHSGKRIILKLNDSYLNQSQMLSIQSLITSYGCILDTVETVNENTLGVARGMNITVQKPIEKRVEQTFETSSNDSFASFNLEIDTKTSEEELEPKFEESQNENPSVEIFEPLKEEYTEPAFEETKEEPVQEYNQEPSYQAPLEAVQENNQTFEESSLAEQTAKTFDIPEEFGEAAKNTIGVYKKAYDENDITNDSWEEVDFYETPVNEPVVTDAKETTYINQTLRSGQILESEGNVVIIGDCHPGSEIRAAGDITVWGVLSGIAHAGVNGNINAKVRALKLNAVQLRIGNCYSRRPDGTNIPYIIKSSIFTPEEARVVDGEIMLFKINQN